MEYIKSLKAFIPGTKENINCKVETGLNFAKKISERKGEYGKQAYKEFEGAMRLCQYGDCPYTVSELREMSNKISPGMNCVDVVWDAASAVGQSWEKLEKLI